MTLRQIGVVALASVLLVGCERPILLWGNLVVGPDMGAAGPFGARHAVMTGDSGNKDDKAPPMRIDIHPQGVTEEATLTGVLEGTKPYLAGVTWHEFTPIVAETNAARMDYWLIGLNLTRTPDRSIYGIVRFPHGAALSVNGVEYVLLSCADLAFAREASFETDAHKIIALDPAPAPEAGDCEFNSLTEAYAATAKMLKSYDRVRHAKDGPALNWRLVKLALD